MIRRASGRAARRFLEQAPKTVGLRGGSYEKGYMVEAYVGPASEAIGWITESVCEASDDEDCWEQMGDLWLPGIEDEDEERVIFIDKMALRAARRGSGWGRRFVETLERWGRQHGAKGAILHAGELWWGDHSGPFWAHMGFEEIFDQGPVMWKDL